MKEYRKITIMRKLPFYHEQQEELQDWFSGASTAIGAFWEKKGSSKQGSGLTFEEEELLLPTIISVPSKDLEFRRHVSRYYRDINTIIPAEGLPLVVSLRDDNKPLSEKNMPVDIDDYVTYRHAMGHPYTARTELEARQNPLKKFYAVDNAALVKVQRADLETVDLAMQDYYELKKNKKKVDMVVTLMGESVGEEEDAIVVLKNIAEKQPVLFHKVANDNDLQLKYEIKNMVRGGVLDLVKGKYLRVDTAETIGTELQTVAWFKDQANSKEVTMFKAMMQEQEQV